MIRFLLFTLLMFLLAPLPALANEVPQWKVDPTQSHIRFSILYGQDPITGSLPNFSAVVNFAPDALEKSSIEATLLLSSLEVDDDDARESLPEEEWLDTANHPVAEFISHEIIRGEQGYVAKGTLTLKGVTHPLDLPFTITLSPDESKAVAKADVILSRLWFGLGEGEWEADAPLAHEIHVQIHIEAQKAAP